MTDPLRPHLAPAAAFAAALAIYLLTLCPTVYVEGSGELIGAVRLLGTPHPTGYPLYCLLGRLCCALVPLGGPVWPVNLTTAITSAAAAAVVALLLCRRGLSPWAALAGGLALGFSRTFWSQAVVAEVYGLSLLTAVLILLTGAEVAARREPRLLIAVGYLWGLGMAAHLSQALLLPGLVLVLAWQWPRLWQRPGLIFWTAVAAVVGYSIVLYLPVRNGVGPGFHWGALNSPSLLWDHLTGALYRSSFFSLPWQGMLLNGQRWLAQLPLEFTPLLLPLVAWGGWAAARRDRSMAVLVALAVLCNLVAALNYHRDPNGLGVFFLTGFAGLAILIGYGADDLRRRFGTAAGALVGVLVPGVLLAANWGAADHRDEWTAYRFGRDILAGLPANAVLVAEGDDASFVVDYLQRIEGLRRDVTLYNRMGRGTDLLTPEQRRLPMAVQQDLQAKAEAALIRQGTRPVCYLAARGVPLADYELAPDGLAYVAVRRGGERPDRPPPGWAFTGEAGPDGDPWVRKLRADYWYMQGEYELAHDRRAAAASAYEQAAVVACESRSMRYNVALALARCDEPTRALPHALAACNLDPWQAAPHRLLAKLANELGRPAEAADHLKRAEALSRKP